MYSDKTVEKYLDSMQTWIKFFSENITDYHVSISDSNDKIGDIANISTAAVLTCPHAQQCKYWCYDIRDCFRHGYNSTTMQARAKNTALLLKDFVRYFFEIRAFLRSYKGAYFRWHVGGETKDRKYRDEMIHTAVMFPEIFFFTYTKEYVLWNEIRVLPSNLIVMYSEWKGLPLVNPYNRPVFKVRFKGDPVPDDCTWKCPGKCQMCVKAHRGCIVGENTWVDEH